VHKGSKAASTKAAAAAAAKKSSSASKKGKGRQVTAHLLAAQELERAAEGDSDYQPYAQPLLFFHVGPAC